MTALPPDVAEFLREPNVAALSTVRPDGRPHVTPVWYEYDGREFIISTPRGTQKLTNVGRKGFAALFRSTRNRCLTAMSSSKERHAPEARSTMFGESESPYGTWARPPARRTCARAGTGMSWRFT